MDDFLVADTLGNATTMTAAIQALPVTVGKFGSRGLFKPKGVATTTISLAMINNVLRIIADSERGENVPPTKREKRRAKKIDLLHLVEVGELLPGDLQDVMAFGGAHLQSNKLEVINNELLRMKKNLDTTLEYHRVGAAQGVIRDKDGSEIYNLFDLFDTEQRVAQFLAGDAKTLARQFFTDVVRKSEPAMAGYAVRGWECFAGAELFDAITNHKSIREVYQGHLEAVDKLNGDVRAGFKVGNVTIWEYTLTVGGIDYVKPNEGHVYPLADDAFLERNGPADWNEAVGTLGLDYYTRAEARKMGKGWDLEAQKNPISLCVVPKALTKITLG